MQTCVFNVGVHHHCNTDKCFVQKRIYVTTHSTWSVKTPVSIANQHTVGEFLDKCGLSISLLHILVVNIVLFFDFCDDVTATLVTSCMSCEGSRVWDFFLCFSQLQIHVSDTCIHNSIYSSSIHNTCHRIITWFKDYANILILHTDTKSAI